MANLNEFLGLTGTWQGSDGSVTYLTEVGLGSGSQIFWESTGELSYVFTNIFMGYRVGSSIIGQYVDVPGQTNYHNIGTLSLEVVDSKTIRQVAASQLYANQIWTKIRDGFPTESDMGNHGDDPDESTYALDTDPFHLLDQKQDTNVL